MSGLHPIADEPIGGLRFTTASGLTATVNQAFETDLAQPLTARKTKTLGQTSETDLAQPITAHKTRALGQTTETDTALAVAWAPKRRLVNLATETDLA